MTIAQELEKDFEKLNEDQKRVVAHDSGPMMVIAGPGSGKTRCLVLRAMNLLLLKRLNRKNWFFVHIPKKRPSKCKIVYLELQKRQRLVKIFQ